MSIFNILSNIFGDSTRNQELKSFAKSEYKNDWEFAYSQLRDGVWPNTTKTWLDGR